ncbi:MAG: hypothetical protein M3Y80_12070 [Verrucomicrobiota bacterium]|nr:hypothetical protein [Verrucomicrobiota bacterium]
MKRHISPPTRALQFAVLALAVAGVALSGCASKTETTTTTTASSTTKKPVLKDTGRGAIGLRQ